MRLTLNGWVVLLLVLLTGCSDRPLAVREAWARPAAAGGTSAVYFVIDNSGGLADILLGVQSDSGEAAEMHETITGTDGTMRMIPVENAEVPAREILSFQPGGKHVMLINLKAALQAGDVVNVTLQFEKAGTIEIDAEVREP